MTWALYLNGVFEDGLREIIAAQQNDPNRICYLQPHGETAIKRLEASPPDSENPRLLYVSVTSRLECVTYRAKIIGWKDKRKLSEEERTRLNRHIARFQPGEGEIYLHAGKGKPSTNLISILDLEHLSTPIPLPTLIKDSDDTPLKVRTRSGGWSYVWPLPEPNRLLAEELEQEFQREVAESLKLSSSERAKQLANSPKRPPERRAAITYVFSRSQHVVAEVLLRADGFCEHCQSKAPFLRASDGTPFLEVHHKQTLAAGGLDTVENAIALCPNCHRYLHHGLNSSSD